MKSIIKLCRVYQYPKNFFVMLPLFFSGYFLEPARFWPSFWGMIAFCFLASGSYIFNDWMDMDLDKKHPMKKNRPLAMGSWIAPFAFLLMLFFLVLGCVIGFLINWNVLLICAAYICLITAYSVKLKHLAVMDILIIAIAFILRLLAGAFAAHVSLSPYIVVMTFFLALFLALGKRHDEFVYCKENNIPARPALAGYSSRLFDIAISINITLMIMGYFMYSVLGHSPSNIKFNDLYLTGFFVIAGAMRYLQLVYAKNQSADPSYLLFHDRILLSLVIFWALSLGVILYA